MAANFEPPKKLFTEYCLEKLTDRQLGARFGRSATWARLWRTQMGLPANRPYNGRTRRTVIPLQPSEKTRKCLCCGKEFIPWHMAKNRICDRCKNTDSWSNPTDFTLKTRNGQL